VRYRGLVFAVSIVGAIALTPVAAAAADAGATLTVPAQVQAAAGASAAVQPSFSFPEATPFCTVGVDYTWDGVAWLSEFPSKNGALCVATGVNKEAPDGHNGAGSHEICGSAGPRFKDCKKVTVVLAAGAAPATAKPNGGTPAQAAPSQAPPPLIPSDVPAPRIITQAANSLPQQSRTVGLVLLGIGVVGLVAILGRRLILKRRRQPTPLPTPGTRR
jgi:hypothetical protein